MQITYYALILFPMLVCVIFHHLVTPIMKNLIASFCTKNDIIQYLPPWKQEKWTMSRYLLIARSFFVLWQFKITSEQWFDFVHKCFHTCSELNTEYERKPLLLWSSREKLKLIFKTPNRKRNSSNNSKWNWIYKSILTMSTGYKDITPIKNIWIQLVK